MASYTNNPYLQSFEMPVFQAPQDAVFNVARQLQMKEDMGLQQIGQQHNQMLHLPTTSQYATGLRDSYMKDVDSQLRKIVTADFSLQENQNTANNLYKPLVNDPTILADLAAGSNLTKQSQFGDNLRTSPKEEDRAQHWSTMDNLLQVTRNKLRQASSPDEVQKAAAEGMNMKYIPYFNATGFLDSELNKFESAGGIYHIDEATGTGYIHTTINGKQKELPLYLWAQSILPEQAKDVFRVQGKMQMYGEVQQRMALGMSETQAHADIAQTAMLDRKQQLADEHKMTTDYIEKLKAKRADLVSREGRNDVNIGQIMQYDSLLDIANQKLSDVLKKRQEYDPSVAGFDKKKYQDTLSSYTLYPDQIYSEVVRNSAIRNWAAGRAGIGFQSKLSKDEPYFEAWKSRVDEVKARTDELKAMKELEVEKQKTAKITGTGSGASPNSDDTKPRFAGENPENQNVYKTYDYFQSVKKAAIENTTNTATSLFGDAFKDEIKAAAEKAGVSTNRFNDFLTFLSTNVKNGAATESPWGKHPDYSGVGKWDNELKVLHQLVENGVIKEGDASYSSILSSMMAASKEKIGNLYVSANTPKQRAQVAQYATQLDYLEKGQAYLEKVGNDEAAVKNDIFNKRADLSDIAGEKGNKISFNEYLDRKGGNKAFTVYHPGSGWENMTVRQAYEYQLAHPNEKLTYATGQTSSARMPGITQTKYRDINDLVKDHKDKYNDLNQKFEDAFSNEIDTGQISTAERQPNGQVGFTYPFLQYDFKKDSTKVGKEKAEMILGEAINPANITRGQDVISNMKELKDGADEGFVRSTLQKLQGALGKLEDGDGILYISKAGADGKNPTVKFKPSPEFIHKVEGSDNSKSWTDSEKKVLGNILQHGISINAPNSVIASETAFSPAFTQMEIKKKGSATLLGDLKDEGFYGEVTPGINGGPYVMTIHYKTYDPTTGKDNDESEPIPLGDISGGDLDKISQRGVQHILDYYYQYKDFKKANSPTKPTKYYTEEEVQQIRRQTQQ